MRFPFVSRERYEERCAEVTALKAERQLLTDRIVMLNGQRPLYATAPTPSDDDGPHVPTEMRPGRPTLMQVQREANLAAQKIAQTPGESIVRNIREGLLKGVKQKNAS